MRRSSIRSKAAPTIPPLAELRPHPRRHRERLREAAGPCPQACNPAARNELRRADDAGDEDLARQGLNATGRDMRLEPLRDGGGEFLIDGAQRAAPARLANIEEKTSEIAMRLDPVEVVAHHRADAGGAIGAIARQ